ncbi:MAG: DinB family protein, partial [Candidatus Methylomirabilia bacterium]
DMATISEQIERMRRTPDELAAALEGKAEAVLARRPAETAWAAKEVVCHLRDTEESFMARFQTILANDEPKLLPVEPDRWALERQYLRNDAAEALQAFRARREETLKLLNSLTPEQWERAGIHATRGPMTVKDFAAFMAWHDDNHLDQLRRALRGES